MIFNNMMNNVNSAEIHLIVILSSRMHINNDPEIK